MKAKSSSSTLYRFTALFKFALVFFSINASSETCIYGDCQNGLSLKQSSKGSMFVGSYDDGKLNGAGRFIDRDGDQCSGIWFEGRMSGETFCRYKNGSIYAGEYYSGKKDGYGIRIAADGKVIQEGLWERGKFVVAMATEYGRDKDLRETVLATKFDDCLIGDCSNGWGIKVGFGGKLQNGNWISSRFIGDESTGNSKNVGTKKESASPASLDLQQDKRLSPDQFRIKVASRYPEVFTILKEDEFKAFIKSDLNINSIFKEVFRTQDLEGISSLLDLYKRHVADHDSPNIESSELRKPEQTLENKIINKPQIVDLNEAKLGIPVQYRSGKESYSNWGIWIFSFLAVPLIGWMFFTYRALPKDPQ